MGGLFLAPLVGLEPTTCGLTVKEKFFPLTFQRPLSHFLPEIMDLLKEMDDFLFHYFYSVQKVLHRFSSQPLHLFQASEPMTF